MSQYDEVLFLKLWGSWYYCYSFFCQPILHLYIFRDETQKKKSKMRCSYKILTWIKREIDTKPWGLLDASDMFL